jgi:hypothetical protein
MVHPPPGMRVGTELGLCTSRLLYRMIVAVGLFSFVATAQAATASDLILNFTNKGAIVGADPWRERLDLAARVSDNHER